MIENYIENRDDKMKDPVCLMEVDEKAKFKSNYKGRVFYFCSAACKQSFDKKPENYAKG